MKLSVLMLSASLVSVIACKARDYNSEKSNVQNVVVNPSQASGATVVYDQDRPYSPQEQGARLTVFAYPASKPLAWTTPRLAIGSFMDGYAESYARQQAGKRTFQNDLGETEELAYGYRSSMGHTILHVQCNTTSGQAYDKWVSYTGQNYREIDAKVQAQEIGLGMLFYPYPDGITIKGIENRLRLSYFSGERGYEGKEESIHPRYVSFNLTTEKCDKIKNMVEYFGAFHYKAGTKYSDLISRPSQKTLYFSEDMDIYTSYQARMKEMAELSQKTGFTMEQLIRQNQPFKTKLGGACAPFAVALLREANIFTNKSGAFDKLIDDSMNLIVPMSEDLIGEIKPDGSRKLNSQGKPIQIGYTDLLTNFKSYGDTWAKPGDKNIRTLRTYDPGRIWDFIGKIKNCIKNPNNVASGVPSFGPGSDKCDTWVKTYMNSGSEAFGGRKIKIGYNILFKDSFHAPKTAAQNPAQAPYGDTAQDTQINLQNVVEGLQFDL